MKKILLALFLLFLGAVVVFFAPAFLKPTLTHESKVTINKSPDEVWKKWTAPNTMDKWLPGFKSMELISGEAETVGSKHRIVIEEDGNSFEAIQTVKEIEKEEKFAFQLDGEVLTNDVVITLENKGLTTEITQKESIKAKGIFWKAMFYWMQSSIHERSQTALDNLKKFIEES